MKPTDLRIGNLVNTVYSDEPFTVSRIGWDYLVIVKNRISNPVQTEYARPIPLTFDWLKRMGFEENQTDDGTVYHSLRLSDDMYCNLSLLEVNKNGIIEAALFPYENFFRYQYVHQIQNLYHAIMGKDITIAEI